MSSPNPVPGSPQNPAKLEEFDSIKFQIIKEPWNIYELEPFAERLKLRWVLTRLFAKSLGSNKFDFQFKSKQLVEIENVPKSYYNDEITINSINPAKFNDFIDEGNMSFETLSEKWNEYQLVIDGEEYRLRVKNGLTEVHRTTIITNEREPLYLVNHSTQMNIRKIDN